MVQLPSPCPVGKFLDPKTSKCVCSQPVQCNRLNLQKFNEESCECECMKVFIPVPGRRHPKIADRCPKGAKTNSKCRCMCPPGKFLDPKTNKCVCSQPVKCNPFQKFNEESCKCECRRVFLPVPRRRRPIRDRCPKGLKTNSRCRCVRRRTNN